MDQLGDPDQFVYPEANMPGEGLGLIRPLLSFYESDDRPFDSFMLPMLGQASRYDRIAGYFSSSSLADGAVGLESFVERRGHIRLVVNAELTREDVDAVEHGLSLREAADRAVERVRFDDPAVGLLAALVAVNVIDIRVAVPLHPQDGRPIRADEVRPLHHPKSGVFYDEFENAVAFSGSNNETHSGWLANYEQFSVYPSWEPQFWAAFGRPIEASFAKHWDGFPRGNWRTYELPYAVRRRLIGAADRDVLTAAARARDDLPDIDTLLHQLGLAEPETAHVVDLLGAPRTQEGVGLATSTVTPWPHQAATARAVLRSWPCSRLLADEVGLGKTIELGATIRELVVSGRAPDGVLLLVPASVIWQWQQEMWEKFTVPVPVLDRGRHVWPDGENTAPPAGGMWRPPARSGVLLTSSFLARRSDHQQELIDDAWSLVVVDEAHHARRRGKPSKNDPNKLLQLLRAMRDNDCWDGLLLATATPMQMHPHEAWDLLDLLGLPEGWDESADVFVDYYTNLRYPDPKERQWGLLRRLLAGYMQEAGPDPLMEQRLEAADLPLTARRRIRHFHERASFRKWLNAGPQELALLDEWLREHTPMRSHVHRATRQMLRTYKDEGRYVSDDLTIPRRIVQDERVDFTEEEQRLYERIEDWISEKYDAGKTARGQKRQALGFILTVYRRRLTSSFHAITESLRRRRDALRDRRFDLFDALTVDDHYLLETQRSEIDVDSLVDAYDLPLELNFQQPYEDSPNFAAQEQAAYAIDEAYQDELQELDEFIAALEARRSLDSKTARLVQELEKVLGGGTPRALVFTQFTDTMDYLREELASKWPGAIACYSGRGGEIHDPEIGGWGSATKEDVKTAFRNADVRLLLGTDAMSEGLNLQTCDWMCNFDLPWNFMRVEQRIGRIDRIGGRPEVTVFNLLIEGTVEENIYDTIAEDYDWFSDVVGIAQPVLSEVESAIEAVALAKRDKREQLLQERAEALLSLLDGQDEETQTVAAEFDQGTRLGEGARPFAAENVDWLERLRRRALHDGLVAATKSEGVYETVESSTTVTFDRRLSDEHNIPLFVWGHPDFPG